MRTILLILLLLAGTGKLFSQTIPISGHSSVYMGSEHTYVADLSGITLMPGATLTWSLLGGGTIISAITDPMAASVYCVVRWSYSSVTIELKVFVSSPAVYGSKEIVVNCRQADAGSNVSICPADSATIGTASVPGYTYLWTLSTGLNNPNIAQPVASPAVTTNYVVKMYPSDPNLLSNGDFENGYANFSSDYVLYPDATNTNGTYEITANPYSLNTAWRNMADYSQTGHMLIADGAVYGDPSGYRFWHTTVNVQPYNSYNFSFFVRPLFTNNYSKYRLIIRSTSGVSLISYEADPVSRPYEQGWMERGTIWSSGGATQATIELEYLPVAGSPANANQLAFDNFDLSLYNYCPLIGDTVTVSVGTRPQVSPSGPIEYYYLEENVSPQIGIMLTSETLPGYQWYKDGVAISGATSQTYKAKSTGTYTVQDSGCPSEGVLFYDHAKGPDDRTSIGEPLDFPAGVHSPTYYCFNSNNYIKTFDLGSSANYYWEIYTPGGATDQISINTSTYNIHSPQADVSIGGSPANATTILGYAELDGYVKAMEFSHFYYSSQSTPLTGTENICAGSSFNVTNYNSFTSSQINPGASRFNWETYDVGGSGEILSPAPTLYPDPSDPTNTKKIRIAGKNGYTGGITVRFNSLPGRIKKYFYTNDGDCYQDSKRYEADPGCRINVNQSNEVSLYPNPARGTVTITAPEDILQAEVLDINYSTVLQVIRSKPGNNTLYLNVSRYKPGVYNCRITTASGVVVNKKLVVTP